jgi:formate-dependent phosphoribosylglycinamide formyltransferase (GAR transformylase)
MPFVIFAAPIFNENAIRFIGATADLPHVQLAVISQELQEKLPPELRARLVGHWQVDNALDRGRLLWAAQSLAQRHGPIHRLMAINEQIQVPLAEAREQLGLAGQSVAVAQNFRDKARMKSLLSEAGLPCARHWLAHSEAEVWSGVEDIGLPLVLKPPAGAGSQFTHRADSAESVAAALRQYPPSAQQPILLEEFITGEEHSLDTFSVNGRVLWHSITRYLPTPLEVMRTPWMQWRALIPREVDDAQYDSIREAGFRALAVLGMQTGMGHMEWFRRADGTVAISEVGMRPAGAQFTTLMSRAHDFDCPAAWARLMVFGEFEPPPRQFAAGAAYLRGQGQGRVKAVHGLEQAHHELGHLVTDVKLPQIGQPAAPNYEGEGYVIVRHEETAVVEQALLQLVSLIRVELSN